MSRLALPYDRFTSRRASPWSRPKASQVFQKPNRAESEPRSDFSSDVTSDFADVTSDITDFSLVPPSPGALENTEQGTPGAAVGGAERRRLGPVLPCVLFSLGLLPKESSSVDSEAPVQT